MKKILVFLAIVGSLFLCTIDAAAGQMESKVVKVGFDKGSDYIAETETGQKSGYGYEYMQELAKIAGWKCEYIAVDSWADCFAKLDEGEIDLLAPVQFSKERALKYDFSTINVGKSYTAILVKSDNQTYKKDDFGSFSGISIGTYNDNYNNVLLDEFAKKCGFTYEPVFYNTAAESREAFEKGEVEAIVLSSLESFEGKSMIAQFNMNPFFCITKKGNEKLNEELNNALSELELRNPDFAVDLYQKYYTSNLGDEMFLTVEEESYLRELGTIRAVVIPGSRPLSYFENGTFKGIVADMMNVIEEKLKIPIVYLGTKSYEESIQMIKEGKADIICSIANDYNLAEEKQLKFTTPYMEYSYNELYLKGNEKRNTVAITEGDWFDQYVVAKNFKPENIVKYKTDEDCIKSVLDGKQDVTYVNTYAAEYSMQRNYREQDSILVKDSMTKISIGLSNRSNPMLFNILDKQISAIDREEREEILDKYSAGSEYEVSFTDYIYRNPLQFVTIIAILAVLGLIFLLYCLVLRRKYMQHIFELAYLDPLLGIWNGSYFEEKSPKIISSHKEKKFAIISMEIYKFTVINKSYGRGVGDQILHRIAKTIPQIFVNYMAMARTKGDRFLILLAYEEQEEIDKFIAKFRETMAFYQDKGIYVKLGFSIGIYCITDMDTPITDAIDLAGLARKKAEDTPTKTVYFDKGLEKFLKLEKYIEDYMQHGLKNREFEVYYQPKMNIITGYIYGAEALVRWNSAKAGFMNPGDFIPIFEGNGFIVELDFFVLEEVCKLIQDRIAAGKKVVPISVNQSRVHFGDPNYTEKLKKLVNSYNIPIELIELEITETVLSDSKVLITTLKDLKEKGFKLSIDDFGTGYSSPIMLKEEAIDTLKIDKSFLDEALQSPRSKSVIADIISMAHELGMDVVCEGVEEQEQVTFLKEVGCIYVQGFFYAKPMPRINFEQKMEDEI